MLIFEDAYIAAVAVVDVVVDVVDVADVVFVVVIGVVDCIWRPKLLSSFELRQSLKNNSFATRTAIDIITTHW